MLFLFSFPVNGGLMVQCPDGMISIQAVGPSVQLKAGLHVTTLLLLAVLGPMTHPPLGLPVLIYKTWRIIICILWGC